MATAAVEVGAVRWVTVPVAAPLWIRTESRDPAMTTSRPGAGDGDGVDLTWA